MQKCKIKALLLNFWETQAMFLSAFTNMEEEKLKSETGSFSEKLIILCILSRSSPHSECKEGIIIAGAGPRY